MTGTKGPWEAVRIAGDGDTLYQIQAHETHSNLTRVVAEVEHWDPDSAEANARLIAQAPALRRAAVAFSAWAADHNPERCKCRKPCPVQEAREAIEASFPRRWIREYPA